MREIPLFDLNYGPEETSAVTDTLKSRWISMGPKCAGLEERFAEMLHVKYACAVTSCTAALHLACCALGLQSGDEVICPSLTFVATANCIRYTGTSPVFCDISSLQNLCMDADELEKLITPIIKAILPMHYAGFPCDMTKLLQTARRHGLFVIEDACHGPMSEYCGKKLGTLGDVGCFSFFSNKNISTGEGGMLVTNSEELYERFKLLRSHGMTATSYERASGHATQYDVVSIGFNYRMDDIRASLACVQLGKLPDDLEKRARVRAWYEEALKGASGVEVPFSDYKEFVSNYIFPIVLKNSSRARRDAIRAGLSEAGVQTSVHYPAVHRFSAYQIQRRLPVTEYVADHEITLPMYGNLREDDVQYICSHLKRLVAAEG